MRPTTSIVVAIGYYFGAAEAFWRLPCRAQSGIGRIDPIVKPGSPSDHTHTVFGSGGFGMDSDAKELLGSDCTTCAVTQDKSAYWIPPLYFVDPSGKAELVKNIGGLLAYYLLRGEDVKAFPDGFKMLAGDPRLRNSSLPVPDPPKSSWSGEQVSQSALAAKALGFNCLHYQKLPPEAALGRHFLPDKAYLDSECTSGIRMELMFPSCWNGKDLDSPDHKSHVAYPHLVDGGDCPEGFDTRVVTLFYETIWDTYAYKGKEGQFVIANGDPTGYGYHGDFIAAWEGDTLKRAVKECTNPSGNVEDCPVFKLQSESDAQQCKFETPSELKTDDSNGPRDGLPGNVMIQAGPSYAKPNGGGTPKGDAPAQSSLPAPPAVPSLDAPADTPVASSSQGGGYGVPVGGAFVEVANTAAPASEPTTSTAEAPAPPSPSPSTTPAPSAPPSPPAGNGAAAVSTTYLTKGREVYEIVVINEEVTVTQTSTMAAGKHRRHLHRHQHRHGFAS